MYLLSSEGIVTTFSLASPLLQMICETLCPFESVNSTVRREPVKKYISFIEEFRNPTVKWDWVKKEWLLYWIKIRFENNEIIQIISTFIEYKTN